jgi:hypothetical protein
MILRVGRVSILILRPPDSGMSLDIVAGALGKDFGCGKDGARNSSSVAGWS